MAHIKSLLTIFQHPIIVIFMIANLAIGWWAHRKAKKNSFEDYALASRDLPTGVLVMTLLGTVIARGDLQATPNSVFKWGLVDGLGLSFLILSFFVIGTFIAPHLVYFDKAITMGDLMQKMYGNASQIITGVFSCIYALLLISSNMKAIGIMGKYLLDIKPIYSIIIFGTFVMLYSAWGGMRSVSYTDVLQTITAFIVFSWIVQKLLAHEKIGGMYGLWDKLKTNHPKKIKVFYHDDIYFKLKSAFFWGLSPIWLLTPPYFQRMLITQDKRKVRKMWYISALFYGFILSMAVIIGLVAIVGQNTIPLKLENKNILFSLTRDLFTADKRVVNILFVGFLAVLLSTMDSYLHSLSIAFLQDVMIPIRQFFKKTPLKSRDKLFYAKGIMILVGTLSIILVLFAGNLLENKNLYKFRVLLTGMIIFPLIIGILGVKTDSFSFYSFSVVFFVGNLGFKYWGWRLYDHFFIGLFLATITYFITHLYINKGIATLKRSKLTISERLWLPSWQGTVKRLHSWVTSPLRIPAIADRKIVTTPTQSLAFSLVMISLYVASSMVNVQGTNDTLSMMAGIRGIGITLCVGLMLEGIWSKSLKPYFPMYWFFTLWYCLPFSGSLAFLQSPQSMVSVTLWGSSFMVLAMLVDSSTFFVLASLGSTLAFGGWRIVYGGLPVDLWKERNANPNMIVAVIVLISIVSMLLFTRQREDYTEKTA